MIMETLSCGYPVGPTGLGSSPITPPASPPDSHSFNPHECSPQLYSETQYSQTAYSSPPIHHNGNFLPRYVEDDANNNNSIYKSMHDDCLNNNRTDSLLGDLSSLSISEDPIIEEEDENDNDLGNRYSASDLTLPGSKLSETDDFASRHVSSSRSSPKTSTSSSSSGRSSKSKKNSRSKSKASTDSTDSGFGSRLDEDPSSRKDSFVYDVRLPDEQFLFFVPDLDLVKSHLMFAVREEVDVLKDRIVELMDRIKHLECENTVLRQYASPEVLQQLQTQMPPHHPSTS